MSVCWVEGPGRVLESDGSSSGLPFLPLSYMLVLRYSFAYLPVDNRLLFFSFEPFSVFLGKGWGALLSFAETEL